MLLLLLLASVLGGIVAALIIFLLMRRQTTRLVSAPSGVSPQATGFVSAPSKASLQTLTASEVSLAEEKRPLVVPQLPPNELVLGSTESPLLTIRAAGEPVRGSRSEEVSIPSHIRNSLASLLQQAPKVLAVTENISTVNRLVLTFSSEATQALARGALELTPSRATEGAFRAIARDPLTKRFVEHGDLLVKVDYAAVAAAAWQIAAIVTAQKFLADIDAKLQQVGNGLRSIRGFLDDQNIGHLLGAHGYISDRADSLKQGHVNPSELLVIRNKIEDIDVNTRSISKQMLKQLIRTNEEVDKSDWKTWISLDEPKDEALALIQKFSEQSQQIRLAGQVRLLAVSLGSVLGSSSTYAGRYLGSLRDDLEAHNQRWEDFKLVIDKKLGSLGARARLKSSEQEIRTEVKYDLIAKAAFAKIENQAITASVSALAAQLAVKDKLGAAQTRLELEVGQGGQIVRAFRLLTR